MFSEGYSVTSSIIMLVVNIFVYLILAWYFERVVPSSVGIRLPLLFFLRPDYWFPPALNVTDEEKAREEAAQGVEAVPEEMRSQVGVRIANIFKNYTSGYFFAPQTKAALEGVTLNLYQDQIFGLLGHNGRP